MFGSYIFICNVYRKNTLNKSLGKKFFYFLLVILGFSDYSCVDVNLLDELKKKHKELEAVVNRLKKKRLNDRTSASWTNLRELKKLKLQIKDKIINLKKKIGG